MISSRWLILFGTSLAFLCSACSPSGTTSSPSGNSSNSTGSSTTTTMIIPTTTTMMFVTTTTMPVVMTTTTSTSTTTSSTSTSTTVRATTTSTTSTTTTTMAAAVNNVVSMSIGGCGVNGYINEPCVSVTICQPGTNNCQTIPNILLDTGSYGLRIFSSVVNSSSMPLNQVGNLYECVQFADGSALWGSVRTADVVMGGERASNVPIQIIDNSAPSNIPSGCPSPDASPSVAGFNGIMGVGLFAVDCLESGCPANVGLYFSCNSVSCPSQPAVPASEQVTNPVAMFSRDNNGVILQIPWSNATYGSGPITGSLIFGIGTQANNTVSKSSVGFYQADNYGNFSTSFGGQNYTGSFIDSGSNGLFFPQPSNLPLCSNNSSAPGFFCPNNLTSESAIQGGVTTVPFSIANASTIVQSGYSVSATLGGEFSGVFDWGLPFFLGRSVYVGINGVRSNLGTGPYWAW